jgi:hypothetical protein
LLPFLISSPGAEGNFLIWENVMRMSISDGHHHKDFRQLLSLPDIKGQFAFRSDIGNGQSRRLAASFPGKTEFRPRS